MILPGASFFFFFSSFHWQVVMYTYYPRIPQTNANTNNNNNNNKSEKAIIV